MWLFGNKVFSIAVLLFIVNETNSLASLTYTLFSEIMANWDNFDKFVAQSQDPNQKILDGIDKANNQLKVIGSQVTDIQTKVNAIDDSIQRITAFIEYYRISLKIRHRAEKMDDFNTYKQIDATTLRNFAEKSVGSGENTIDDLLKMLSNWFIGSDQITIGVSSLLDLYLNWMKKFPELVCKLNLTPQHFLYLLYDDFLTTNLKAYTIAQFSYMIMQNQTNKSYCSERNILYDDVIERAKLTKDLVSAAIQNSSRTLWKCEPKEHVKGSTYDDLTRFVQAFVAYKSIVSNDVYGYCEDLPRKPVSPRNCNDKWYCKDKPECKGKISDCFSGGEKIRTCSSTDPNRRYDKFSSHHGGWGSKDVYYGGTNDRCNKGDKQLKFGAPLESSLCICFCFDDDADSYFNLREVRSNVAENMVVTGVRFRKHNKIFHLEIQEGQLIANRKINASTLRWLVDDYKITDPGIEDGKDYFRLTYSDRKFPLTTLDGGNFLDTVLTGFKFRPPNEDGLMSFEIFLNTINRDGMINASPNPLPYGASINPNELGLGLPDNPTKTYNSTRNWTENQYVKFTLTDLYKDAGQNTVPFIDVQEVTSNPPGPLSGLGFYFKGVDGYGGFIAPRTLSYNYTKYLSSIEIENKPFECCEVRPNESTGRYESCDPTKIK